MIARVGWIGGVEEFEEFDEFAAAMTVPDEGMNFAAEKVDAGQTVCPSLKRPTHPRCYGEVTRIGRAEPQTRRASRGPA